jgi:hypothetical protein
LLSLYLLVISIGSRPKHHASRLSIWASTQSCLYRRRLFRNSRMHIDREDPLPCLNAPVLPRTSNLLFKFKIVCDLANFIQNLSSV